MDASDLLLLCATVGEAGALEDPADSLAAVPHRLVLTGIGPVNTAHALTRAVEGARPAAVLQFGVGGAYVPAGLAVGSLAVASEEIYGDLGVLTPRGWRPADLIGIPVVPGAGPGEEPRYNRFPLDAGLVRRALALLQGPPGMGAAGAGAGERGPGPAEVRAGPFLTLSQVTGVRTVGDELYRRSGALCESMEGAAAAHVCALYRLPFLEVRGISNLVEDRDRERWRIAPAERIAQEAVRRLAAGLLEWSKSSSLSESS
jgi:futalosine hydrolase